MDKIKLLFMDVDGTLTDGKIYIGESGEVFKAFDARDGYAIFSFLPLNDIVPVIITGRKSKIVELRCKELGINELYQGCSDKSKKVEEIALKYGIKKSSNNKFSNTAFIGDDIADLSAMKICQVSGCPSDAVNEVKKIATYVCKNKCGDGAVREFIEWLLA